jgi:hypothetical protein
MTIDCQKNTQSSTQPSGGNSGGSGNGEDIGVDEGMAGFSASSQASPIVSYQCSIILEYLKGHANLVQRPFSAGSPQVLKGEPPLAYHSAKPSGAGNGDLQIKIEGNFVDAMPKPVPLQSMIARKEQKRTAILAAIDKSSTESKDQAAEKT